MTSQGRRLGSEFFARKSALALYEAFYRGGRARRSYPSDGEDDFRATDRRRDIECGHRMTPIPAIRRRPISYAPERRRAIGLDAMRETSILAGPQAGTLRDPNSM